MKSDFWVIHDGKIICGVSSKVLLLFQCAESYLIDKSIFDIIPILEMRELARLRIGQIVENAKELPPQKLPFQRPDGSVFWAQVQTFIVNENTFMSTMEYLGTTIPDYRGT